MVKHRIRKKVAKDHPWRKFQIPKRKPDEVAFNDVKREKKLRVGV